MNDESDTSYLLNSLLSLLRAQYWNYQTSHWQVGGHDFYGNHLLFQRLYEGTTPQIDELAEKMVAFLGAKAVHAMPQVNFAQAWLERWNQTECPYARGLMSEDDFQNVTKQLYDAMKAAGTLSLGLDDWLMATANAHETNTYLLQQVLSGQQSHNHLASAYKAADDKMKVKRKDTGKVVEVSKDTLKGPKGGDYEKVDDGDKGKKKPDQQLKTNLDNAVKRLKSDGDYDEAADYKQYMDKVDKAKSTEDKLRLLDEAQEEMDEYIDKSTRQPDQEYRDGLRRVDHALSMAKQWLNEQEGKKASIRALVARYKTAETNPGDSGAGSEEGRFFDNPEKREVREFAQTDAMTNAPDVAAEAASEENLDIPKAEAVSEAKEAPPTPTEIVEEPGGEAVSTLNRYIVETGEDVPSSVPSHHDEVPKHPVLASAWSNWNTL
ncbi:hypothetical protein N9917_01060 [Deltaproteobacteria bacterium]|nr:hypothetical protein [Deltaproteobacteria bacterium]